MQRPLSGEYAPNYQKYFDLVPEGNFFGLLALNTVETITFFENLPSEKLDHKYAEDKWTVKEILMHLIDTERVFAYRALVAARGDSATEIYRMDEELYANNVDVSGRTLQSLISEFETVRGSARSLFEYVTDAESILVCNIVTHPMTTRAIGYFMIAHVRHHLNVIKERYL